MFNIIKIMVLFGAFILIVAGLGFQILGYVGLVIGSLCGLAFSWLAYDASDEKVLTWLCAKEVDTACSPVLYQVVTEVVQRAKLPMPRVYVIHNTHPNVFSLGSRDDKLAIVVTSGLLKLLDGRELRVVIAHECSHLKHKDSLTVSVTAYAISNLTDVAERFKKTVQVKRNNIQEKKEAKKNKHSEIFYYVCSVLLNTLAAIFVQIMASRTQDYKADRFAVEIYQDAHALVSALQKIKSATERIPFQAVEDHPATAPLFFINPFSTSDSINGLFVTQPLTDARVKKLLGE